MTASSYDRFRDPVFRWDSVGLFVEESAWVDGIHAIRFEGGHFDVLIRGGLMAMEGSRSLPVFFSGAVQRDGTAPPFFSGTTLARQTGVPVVAVSDPTLHSSDQLSIGWYTGPASGSFQEILPQFLVALRSAVGREIVLVGGSAGGFASLFYSSVVGCAAFVWNPQTDLLRYGAWAVREYLVAVLDDPRWGAREGLDRHAVEPIDLATARRELSQAGIESMVGPADRIAKLVYLQNSSDHHLERHAEPYRFRNGFRDLGDGLYGQNSTLMAVGPFSEGHRAPRREIIENALHLAIEPDVDLESGLRRLREL